MNEPGVIHRLERIEEKLDELSAAVIVLARVEERQVAQSTFGERLSRRIEILEEKTEKLLRSESSSGVSLAWIERGAWVLVTAALAWILGKQ